MLAPGAAPLTTLSETEPTPDPAATPEYLAAAWSDVADIGAASLPNTTANAIGQPQGALTGVTVFVSAGHGWTAATEGDWFLQRPVLLGMAEDYGNIDQINYFAQYAFNAGATVVPLRPLGWQPIEVVLDNDDPGVTFTGSWNDGSATKYYENNVTNSGVIYRWIAATVSESATARYTPVLPESGYYPVYAWALGGDNRTLQTYRVAHAGGTSAVAIDHREVGNGWIWLGNYYFDATENNYVEITNQSPDAGAVIADAIRFGGGMGDIVRPGPGSISGYPRDEEAQRYWAQSEFGINAVGFSSDIWDVGASDQGDNVRAGAKMAREMNIEPSASEGGVQHERWRRIHLEYHSNAAGSTARGQITLLTTLPKTTYQVDYATILADEFDADMLLIDDEFEHPWFDRGSPTFESTYGAITADANGNEFDATIIEVAFHDNQQDAELLRDPRVRAAMGRASVHGIIRFLNQLPDSEVPLAFAPDTPDMVHAVYGGNGEVTLAWDPPLADGARGDAATGYVVYQSDDGFGFGDPIVLGNQTSVAITDMQPGETRYFRIAATNAGGESMPSEVLAARYVDTEQPRVLIVNAFDRLRRQNNPIQVFDQPAAYANDQIERQINRDSNAFDYAVEHAEALAANGYPFDYASNEAIMFSQVFLSDYEVVVWISGTESSLDDVLSGNERIKLDNYLTDGGALFMSGSNIAYDLVGLSQAVDFAETRLGIGYATNDIGINSVQASSGGIFDGMLGFDFGLPTGARYAVPSPDGLNALSNAVPALQYTNGAQTVAAVQVAGPTFNTVMLAFPFESIGDPTVRAEIMARAIPFLVDIAEPLQFDADNDGDVDFDDFGPLLFCYRGPGLAFAEGSFCTQFDTDGDRDIDMASIAAFQLTFTGPQ
jgi:hypothetical protein